MKKATLLWIFNDWLKTQDFGQNSHFYSQFGLKGHEGIDFGIPVGTLIKAAHNGVIIKDIDESTGAYGVYNVLWDPQQSIATYYCHLSKNLVQKGQKISMGETIGLSGDTGRSTGPHLHFGIVFTDENGVRKWRNNGYKGFVDSLAPNWFEWIKDQDLTEGEKKYSEEEYQAVMKDRNKFWRERDECLRELTGFKKEVKERKKTHEDLLNWFANNLGAGEVEKIKAEIVKLVNLEDDIEKERKRVEELLSDLESVKNEKDRLKKEMGRYKEDKKASEIAAKKSKQAKKELESNQKGLKLVREFNIVNFIVKVFVKEVLKDAS